MRRKQLICTYTWGRANLSESDLVSLTEMETIPTWSLAYACSERSFGSNLSAVTPDGISIWIAIRGLLELKPSLVSFTHMSNVLGAINPAREIHSNLLTKPVELPVDALSPVPHFHVDVQEIQPDLLAFSAHKMLGPKESAVLYGRKGPIGKMPPSWVEAI